MIPFKGHLVLKQYMHDKQTKWGVKVCVLADARNGYVKKFEVYNGKGKGNQSRVGLCSRVVLNLMEGLHNSRLHLYTDNFSTSPLLFHHLYRRGINACGTVRSNRKYFPQDQCNLHDGHDQRFRKIFWMKREVLVILQSQQLEKHL